MPGHASARRSSSSDQVDPAAVDLHEGILASGKAPPARVGAHRTGRRDKTRRREKLSACGVRAVPVAERERRRLDAQARRGAVDASGSSCRMSTPGAGTRSSPSPRLSSTRISVSDAPYPLTIATARLLAATRRASSAAALRRPTRTGARRIRRCAAARPSFSRLRYSEGTLKSTVGRCAATVAATLAAVGHCGSRMTVAPSFSPANRLLRLRIGEEQLGAREQAIGGA